MTEDETRGYVRRAYESGRIKRASVLTALVVCAAAPFASMSPSLVLAASLTAVLMLVSVFSMWRGLAWERGFWRGLLAGLVPLSFAWAARPFGHGCEVGGHCYSWCIPACAAGGVVAALCVVKAAARAENARHFGLSSALATLSVGTLGCSCVSMTGAMALAVAYLALGIPSFVWLSKAGAVER